MRLGSGGSGLSAVLALSIGLVLSVSACAGGDKQEATEQVAPEGEAASEEPAAPVADEKTEDKKDDKKDKKDKKDKSHKKDKKDKGHKKSDKKKK